MIIARSLFIYPVLSKASIIDPRSILLAYSTLLAYVSMVSLPLHATYSIPIISLLACLSLHVVQCHIET